MDEKREVHGQLGRTRPHQRPRRARLRRRLRMAICVYAALSALLLGVAYVVKVCAPESGWSERIINPVAAALEFIDAHWKAMIFAILPIIGPVAVELSKRLKSFAGFQLYDRPVDVRAEAPRAKPSSGHVGSDP